jgi:hypothetical protein
VLAEYDEHTKGIGEFMAMPIEKCRRCGESQTIALASRVAFPQLRRSTATEQRPAAVNGWQVDL